MKPHPENSYIETLLSHDEVEIEKIYKQFTSSVTSFVLSNSGTVDEAKDLFQETLIDLYRMGKNGFVLTCPFKPYFLAMCRYKWLDQIKRKKRRNNKESDAFEVTNLGENGLEYIKEDIITQVGKEQQYQLYREKFEQLSPTCKEIIGLGLVENEETGKTNTLKDIAALLDLNYSYVRREKNNCLNRLIAAIKEDPRY